MKRKIFSILLAASLVATSLTACGNKENSPDKGTADTGSVEGEKELTKIKVGVSAFQDTLLPIIGAEKGWYEEAGLEVEFVDLDWNAIMPALENGSVDIAVYNTTGVVEVSSTMEDVVYLYPWNIFTNGNAIIAREGEAKTVEDFEKEGQSHDEAVVSAISQLRGSEVVTTSNTDMGKAVDQAAVANGVDMSEYSVIDLEASQGLAAFMSGTGDFYSGGIPQRSRLSREEGYVIVATGPDLCDVPMNGWVTKEGFYEKNEDAVLALQNVMFRIIRYARENTEEAGEIITNRLNQDTASEMTVDDFVYYFEEIEDYPANAKEVQEDILSEDGFAYIGATWNDDVDYCLSDGSVTEAAYYKDTQNCLAEEFQAKYTEKYGLEESGY